jgi:hypothetical protein
LSCFVYYQPKQDTGGPFVKPLTYQNLSLIFMPFGYIPYEVTRA